MILNNQNEFLTFLIEDKKDNIKLKEMNIFEKYQSQKIPFELFKQFLNEHANNELFKKYCQTQLNINDQFIQLLDLPFESLTRNQIHETYQNIIKFNFKPSIQDNEKIDIFM